MTLERGFVEEGARRILAIYDANVSFASLAGSDKIDPIGPPETDDDLPQGEEKNREGKPGSGQTKKVPLMANERVIYTHETDPEGTDGFRLLAIGKVSRATYEAMKAFAEFQLNGRPPLDHLADRAHNPSVSSEQA